MRREFSAVLWILTVVLMSTPAMADWNPGDPIKMHFAQLPDPTGWDVFNTKNDLVVPPVRTVLGDDWQCTETGEVNEIHIWGSWRGDMPAAVSAIHVQIHADDRTGPFSKPADVPLWSFSTHAEIRVGTTRTPARSSPAIT